jgi:predicted metal-binding protein
LWLSIAKMLWKDICNGYHPSETHDIDEVKEVMGEYSRAILLCGEDGQLLTEIAWCLEGEVYQNGFYKAFALTALSAGGNQARGRGAQGAHDRRGK